MSAVAYLRAQRAPLQVSTTEEIPTAGPGEMVVRARAVAANPFDHIVQRAAGMVTPWLRFPVVLGTDVAGDVVAVGSDVTRFRVGDRVLGYAVGMAEHVNAGREGAFREHVVLRAHMAAAIPAALTFERAAVVPLGASTAACALFMQAYLGLAYPKATAMAITTTEETQQGATATTDETHRGKMDDVAATESKQKDDVQQVVLVWGGSTSVGCNAIQLARAAGFAVITTASPRNHAYLHGLGASAAFDYRSPTAVADIVAAMGSRKCAGAVAIGPGSLAACIDVLAACKDARRFVAQATYDMPDFPEGMLGMPAFLVGMLSGLLKGFVRSKLRGVKTKFISGADLERDEGLRRAIFEDFLPAALERKVFVPAPETQVVGHGLGCVQEALDLSRKGVSARKLVVTL